MRFCRGSVSAACLALPLGACGGSSDDGVASEDPAKTQETPEPEAAVTTAPAPAPGTKGALGAARAGRLAAAAILTSRDLPGFLAEAQTHEASDDEQERKINACLGIAQPTYVVRNYGRRSPRRPWRSTRRPMSRPRRRPRGRS